MESAASIYLKFEMRTPTTNCFMWRNVHAAQGSNEVPSLELEFFGNYVAKLLLEVYFGSLHPLQILNGANVLIHYINFSVTVTTRG
ncbi:hypothetical protein ACHQM5_017432 [Ranunculus cassubicifolius]